jgi:uncharacterized protein (DUF169 family)
MEALEAFSACLSLSRSRKRAKSFRDLRRSGEFSDDAVVAGEIFRQLQELRHATDYDPGYRISRNETLRLIEVSVRRSA